MDDPHRESVVRLRSGCSAKAAQLECRNFHHLRFRAFHSLASYVQGSIGVRLVSCATSASVVLGFVATDVDRADGRPAGASARESQVQEGHDLVVATVVHEDPETVTSFSAASSGSRAHPNPRSRLTPEQRRDHEQARDTCLDGSSPRYLSRTEPPTESPTRTTSFPRGGSAEAIRAVQSGYSALSSSGIRGYRTSRAERGRHEGWTAARPRRMLPLPHRERREATAPITTSVSRA